MYASHIQFIFGSWDAAFIRKLFGLIAGLFLVIGVTTGAAAVFISGEVTVAASLLVLLGGLHVHYMMVRSDIMGMHVLRPDSREFLDLVGDIIVHEEFNKLANFAHHDGDLLDHVKRVSYLSYIGAKLLSLDCSAAARGGLLHDFFLYDWRLRKREDISRVLHGRNHPFIALENARRYFEVNDKEADIITQHMFPKTRSLPQYPESYLVSLCDKAATLYEYGRCFVAGRCIRKTH
ncbi:MAG: HD domain-containing protein [Spirochaetota bacterium]